MRPLPAAELLELWERGAGCPPAAQALALLAAASDDLPGAALARLPIGRRDARLWRLREQLFGPRLACRANCPACGAALEWDLTAADLGVNGTPETPEPESDAQTASSPGVIGGQQAVGLPLSPTGGEGRGEGAAEATFTFTDGDWEARFRLPTSADLKTLSPEIGLEENRQRLLRACLLELRRGGQETPADAVPAEFAQALAARMAELDPLADVRLQLHCPDCAHTWEAGFDIVSFFWAELNGWAARLLREVHELASAYGWSEAEILALSPQRRQAYLGLVRA